MKKIVMGFALAALIMAIAATFFGCSTDVGEPEQLTEAAVTEPIQISEVTTAIKEVIYEYVSEKYGDEEEKTPVATEKREDPTEKDFADFEDLMYDVGQRYDCKSEDAVRTAYCIAIGRMGGMYRNYYSSDDVEYISGVPDPGNIFRYDEYKEGGYEYERYPADKVDFILRNILNVEPDHSYIVRAVYGASDGSEPAPLMYYHDGYYYVDFSPSGSTVSGMNVTGWYIDSDGKYVIDIDTLEDEEVWYSMTVVAELKNINGTKVWSIYEITMDL